MKNFALLITVIVTLILTTCKKEIDEPVKGKEIDSNDLSFLAEKFISLKTNQQIYVDSNNNEYLTVSFNIDTLSHIFGVYMLKDKKYHFSLLGENCTYVDFTLLKSNKDTLFKGEDVWFYGVDKYIDWTSNTSDTFYICLNYKVDINFHTINYRVTFEDMTNKNIVLNYLDLLCSGDWYINESGYLALICHQTNLCKWAKIEDDSLYNYTFSYNVGQTTGRPDNYIGAECYAAKIIEVKENMPSSGYAFDVIGPASWRLSYWSTGGIGFEYGYTSNNLAIGAGSWNNIELKTFGDSISYSVNDEKVIQFRNVSFLDNGLYIIVADTKQDTILFKDIKLEK
jgi:hypothetical protein